LKRKLFKPTIHRIKLNSEQAVLFCSCFNTGWNYTASNEAQPGTIYSFCFSGKATGTDYNCGTVNHGLGSGHGSAGTLASS